MVRPSKSVAGVAGACTALLAEGGARLVSTTTNATSRTKSEQAIGLRSPQILRPQERGVENGLTAPSHFSASVM